MTFRYWLAESIIVVGLRMIGRPNLFNRFLEIHRDQKDRLARIAALENPGANATVRKMARIARGEV